ncbi:TPA: hypothetical protein ACNV3W_002993 [Raoultella ornithinolytica]|nr:hypothetical protein [Raoultella ornithinolytica]HCD1182214.1 hypothetical protein [Raoultella ornithinolytica]HDT5900579.1 hypothetical protein [Raoultella ornithinolytica]HDT5911887.1 hypothetical protein [Raoultella ornithinolytica]HDT5917323.1 hypothetical protein [Raoultella ornithinolytica]
MTDITELAQSKALHKKLNRRLNDAFGFQRTSGGKHTTISLSIEECKSVIAAFDERLVLVEALEKAQQRIAELEDAEQKLCVANVTLDARAELAERRLAEMESRTVTVKLPDYRNTYKGTFADEVEHQVRRALDLFSADAGIKWEAD